MNKLQELEEQLSAIQAQIDEMKNAEEEWPKFGDEVWTIGMEGKPIVTKFAGTPMWRYKLATGSLQRTKEEAAAYRDWLTSPRTQARRMVEMCDGFDLNGMYPIFYRKTSFERVSIKDGSLDGSLRFSSREQVKAAIDKLGEETIKLALGVE